MYIHIPYTSSMDPLGYKPATLASRPLEGSLHETFNKLLEVTYREKATQEIEIQYSAILSCGFKYFLLSPGYLGK